MEAKKIEQNHCGREKDLKGRAKGNNREEGLSGEGNGRTGKMRRRG